MADHRIDAAQIAGTVDWLEEDHRQLRAQVSRLEQELEQVAVGNRELALRQRADVADIEGLRQQLHRVPSLEEALHQVQEDVGDLRALVIQQASAQERAERSAAIELERLRIQLAETHQRLAVLGEEIQPFPVRIQALGDHARRLQDQITSAHQISEELLGRQASLQSKIDLSVEQAHRLEQAIATLADQFAPLRREDEVLASRIQLAMDVARQVEQKMAEVLVEEQARRELAERVEILRAERQRLQQQIGDLEHSSSSLLERAEELDRLQRQETGRRLALAERITEIESRLIESRQATSEAVIQIWQTVEDHRRRDILNLQEQAKHLRDTVQRLTRPLASDET